MASGSRRLRRALIGASTAAIGLAILVGTEVLMAIRAPMLPAGPPFELDGQVAGADARGEALTVLWLGDSTTSGVGASSADRALPRLVARGLPRPVRLKVVATSGARLADVLADQLGSVAAVRPDVVVVAVGSNDVTHVTGRAVFAAGYARLLATIRATRPEATTVVLGIGDFGGIPRFAQPLRAIAGWRARTLDEVIHDTAGALGGSYVDIFAATAPAFRADPQRHYAADEFHPSDAGYRLWADAVLAILRPLVPG